MLIIGLSLLLYPTVSDYWNSLHQSRAIASYVDKISSISQSEYDSLLAEAEAYNKNIDRLTVSCLTDEQREEYYRLLDVQGNGIMGYLEIPKISCKLPLYHGTSESVLQVAAGHLEGSSLPVGGAGSHCVISGHRGLPNAKLFTNLDQLKEGDVFVLYVLNEERTYQVDQISVVLPEDISNLTFEDGKDLCTLVTCTPYGVNSHRLLVRGKRIENGSVVIRRVVADATQISKLIVTAATLVPPLLLFLIGGLIARARRKRKYSNF